MAQENENGETDTWVPSGKHDKSEQSFNFNKVKEFAKQRNTKIGLLVLIVVIIIIIIVVLCTASDAKQKVPSITEDNSTQRIEDLNGHKVIYRDQWNGLGNGTIPKSSMKLKTPVPLVVVEQVGQIDCYSQEACSSIVRSIQSNSIAENAADIYHNFILGGDGNIYVGRGWEMQPQEGDNRINLAIIGNFNFDKVNNKTIDASQQLLKYGIDRSLLRDDYNLVCHNQTVVNGNCGSNLYSEIRGWKHFDPGQYFDK